MRQQRVGHALSQFERPIWNGLCATCHKSNVTSHRSKVACRNFSLVCLLKNYTTTASEAYDPEVATRNPVPVTDSRETQLPHLHRCEGNRVPSGSRPREIRQGAVSPQGNRRDTVDCIRRHGPHITAGTNNANHWPRHKQRESLAGL